MAPTVMECIGHPIPTTFTEVKEYVRYKLGDFPFTTARKIHHLRCDTCKGGMSLDLNKELTDDMCKNRLFIQEQDKLYSVADATPIIPINGYVQPNALFDNDWRDKQWHTGYINYLRYRHDGDKISIVPASHDYLVYCNENEKLSVASKQFVKPDDYFKLVSIQ